MGWFCLLWTILFAVNVSCQQLTTLLPQDNDACMRSEVIFTCTVRGSLTLTELILAWSSTEYIGQGDPLQFTTQDTPGANNMSSMINGDVTATLISNTRIGGVPELVSELHVVNASQTSVITCSSTLNQSSVATTFISSAFPGRPRNGEARERSAGSCDFQVTWDPPTDVGRFDIDRYIIYVPSRNMMNISFSTTIDLIIPDCRVGNNSIQVAAMNRLGCIGPSSSYIQLSLLEIQDPPSDGLSPGAVGGIVGGIFAFGVIIVFIMILVVLLVACCNIWEDVEQEYERDKEQFTKKLEYLIEAIRESDSTSKPSTSTPLVQTFARDLLELMKKSEPSDIKETLATVLATKFLSARGVQATFHQLKKIQQVELMFDTQLKKVTVDELIKAAEEGNHQKLIEEVKKQVNNASPEVIKDNLKTLFEALQNYWDTIIAKEKKVLQDDFAKCLEYLIKAVRDLDSIRRSSVSTPLVPTFARDLLELMEKLEPSDIKEPLKTTVFETKTVSPRCIQETLQQLKKRIPKVMSTFDTGVVNIDQLIKAPKEGNLIKNLLDKLKEQVNNASPEVVKDGLQKLFQALKDVQASRSPRPPFRRRPSGGGSHSPLLKTSKLKQQSKAPPTRDDHASLLQVPEHSGFPDLLPPPQKSTSVESLTRDRELDGPPGGEIQYVNINQGPRAPVFSGPVSGVDGDVVVVVEDTF